MNSADWKTFLLRLPADLRELAGNIIDRVTTILAEASNHALDDIQRVERRMDTISTRQGELAARLDAYEDQRARDVRLELDRRLADTITREEHDGLLTTIFELTARIVKIEPLADFAVRVHAAEQRCVELQTQVIELLKERERGGDAG